MRCRLFAPVLLLAWPSVVVAQKALEPIDMFRLEYLMVMGAEDPKDWLDGAHYLVFDEGARARPGQTAKRWSAVAAASGKREVFVDRDAVKKSIAALLGNEDGLDEVLDDASAWTWNKDHTHFVLNGKQDLFYGDRAGVCRQLTKTPTEPEVGVLVSPDGAFVSFVADYNLHLAPVAGGDVRALTKEGHSDLFFGRLDWVYQEELYGRGNFQGYWWSPDSKHIALLKLDESPVEEFVLVRESPARPAVEKTNYPKTGEPNPIVEIGAISDRRRQRALVRHDGVPGHRPAGGARHLGARRQGSAVPGAEPRTDVARHARRRSAGWHRAQAVARRQRLLGRSGS
jgi:hypothetical protein